MRALLIMFSLLLPFPALAAITIRDAWAPPSLVGNDVGVAYLTIESGQDDRLVSVSSPVAKVVEIHTHEKDGDVLRMRKLPSLPLTQNEHAVFEPRGLHLMLYGLNVPLKEGEHFPLTLHFTHARPATVTAVVSQQKLDDFLK